MSIDVRLIGKNKGQVAKVNGEGELTMVMHTHPPNDEQIEGLPVRQFFTDDGTADGAIDMRVDGSVTPVDFYIKASADFDIYIKTLSVRLGDPGARLNLFGAIAALTNGIEFTHNTTDNGTLVLHDGIKDNLAFVRLGLSSPAIGGGTTAFRADTTGGGEDTYLPVIDFKEIFGLPWGLRLRKNTKDTLKFTIRDDVTAVAGIAHFDIVAYGIKI